jgi:hypothetical protein
MAAAGRSSAILCLHGKGQLYNIVNLKSTSQPEKSPATTRISQPRIHPVFLVAVPPISESKFWHQPLTTITLCQLPDPPGAQGCQEYRQSHPASMLIFPGVPATSADA